MSMKLPPATPGAPRPLVSSPADAPVRGGESTSPSSANAAKPDARLTEPEFPLPSRDGRIAGPLSVGVGLVVYTVLGGATQAPTEPSTLAPVMSTLQGLGQLSIACVVAGVLYAKLKLAGRAGDDDAA
jgi:hypothetical protein